MVLVKKLLFLDILYKQTYMQKWNSKHDYNLLRYPVNWLGIKPVPNKYFPFIFFHVTNNEKRNKASKNSTKSTCEVHGIDQWSLNKYALCWQISTWLFVHLGKCGPPIPLFEKLWITKSILRTHATQVYTSMLYQLIAHS